MAETLIEPLRGTAPQELWAWIVREDMLPSVGALLVQRATDWARSASALAARGPRLQEWYFECTIFGYEALRNAVDVDPKRVGGMPVLKGTRFTVAQTLAELAQSSAVTELAENFDLDAGVITEMLEGLALVLSRPFPK